MCEETVEINTEEEWYEFLESATEEELLVLKEDILNGTAIPEDDEDDQLFLILYITLMRRTSGYDESIC